MEPMVILGIILLAAGFILIGVEMCIPGFGIPGILGIACLAEGIILAAQSIEEGLTIAMIVVVILAVMLTLVVLFFKRVKAPFILEEDLKKTPEYLNNSDLEYLVGKEGVASTDLKPSGKCDIEGVEFDVRAQARYIKKGTKVKIIHIHENMMMVKAI